MSGNVQAFGRAGSDLLRIDTIFFDAALLIDGNGDFIFLANGGTEVAMIQRSDGADLISVVNQTAGCITGHYARAERCGLSPIVGVRSVPCPTRGRQRHARRARQPVPVRDCPDRGTGAFDRYLDLGDCFFGAFVTRDFEL